MPVVIFSACLDLERKFSIINRLMLRESKNKTLNERKSRMPQMRGIKGEAVVVYCESFITKEMGCYRLSRRVNKVGFFKLYISLIEDL